MANIYPILTKIHIGTTQFDDLNFTNRDWLPKMRPHFFNGTRHLIPTLLCHTPHWLVLLLGTNDLQEQIQKMYELRRIQEYELGQMAGETAQMPHGRASGAYRNPRNTAGKNKKNYINISPEKKAEEIALSVVAMAYEAKRHFPKLRVVIMTPPPLRLTEDNAEWGFNEMSVTIASYFPYAFGKICRLHDIPNVCYPPNSIDMSLSEDGVHITEEHNQIYADALGEFLLSYKCQRPRRRRKVVEIYCPEAVTSHAAVGSDYLANERFLRNNMPQYT